jgi:hypothetical protein
MARLARQVAGSLLDTCDLQRGTCRTTCIDPRSSAYAHNPIFLILQRLECVQYRTLGIQTSLPDIEHP